MSEVFISYSRKDIGPVRRMHAALAARERQTWVDWEGIPPTAEWMQEIRGAIDAAQAFAFVLSPDSLASRVCREELEHAVAQGKRLIPVVCRDVVASEVPEALAGITLAQLARPGAPVAPHGPGEKPGAPAPAKDGAAPAKEAAPAPAKPAAAPPEEPPAVRERS